MKKKNQKSKRGYYWYMCMTPEQRINFKAEVIHQRMDLRYILRKSYTRFRSFIVDAFLWIDTLNGVDYWCELSECIITGVCKLKTKKPFYVYGRHIVTDKDGQEWAFHAHSKYFEF